MSRRRLREDDVLVGPASGVRQRAPLDPFGEFVDVFDCLLKLVVVADNGGGLGHHLAEFLMDAIGVFAAPVRV